jgi:membrane-associated phospholipid phosphatase
MWEKRSRIVARRPLREIWHLLVLSGVGCVGMASCCHAIHAQGTEQTAAAEAAAQKSAAQTIAADETPQKPQKAGAEREVSWRGLPRNFLQDQKDIWLFPVQLGKGRHWAPTIAVTGVTAALIAADPHDTPYFRRTQRFEGFNEVFSGRNTALGMAIVPAAFLVVGHFRHDSYAEKTALLAGEAYADSAIVDIVMKAATRRLRPSDIAPNGNFSDTFFSSTKAHSWTSTSFPSGHAAAAFSIATVFAHRYRRHRWVPWVAYGAAGAISFSRLSTQAHFPSDVFLGAALGFTISEFSVLRPR